jgi:CheY-like chemotaxis protein
MLQRKPTGVAVTTMSQRAGESSTIHPTGGAYGVQVLIAGRRKHWRDEVASQIRRAGYRATTVDCGVDAMTVLALGLPVDVLVSDVTLEGELCCARLAVEARVLRPDLRIVFASDLSDGVREAAGLADHDLFVAREPWPTAIASTVREALAARS